MRQAIARRIGWLALSLSAAACSGAGPVVDSEIVVEPIAPSDTPSKLSWVGTWRTNWGQVDIIADGNRLLGSFSYKWEGQERVGTLVGEPVGNQLPFRWSEQKGSDKGLGRFVMSADGGKFSGHYGYDTSDADAGSWSGRRVRESIL